MEGLPRPPALAAILVHAWGWPVVLDAAAGAPLWHTGLPARATQVGPVVRDNPGVRPIHVNNAVIALNLFNFTPWI